MRLDIQIFSLGYWTQINLINLETSFKEFLREVFSSDKFGNIDQVDVEGMDLSKVEIQREWRNIDILIKLENVVVCVENKVLSKEHSNQLRRYKEIIENQFPNHHHTFVFLHLKGVHLMMNLSLMNLSLMSL